MIRLLFFLQFRLPLSYQSEDIRSGHPLGLAPSEAFQNTVTTLEDYWTKVSKNSKSPEQMTDVEKQAQQAQQQLQSIVREYSTPGWKACYTVASIIALTLLNSTFFFSSLVYSRMILREMIGAARVFTTVTLLIANFALAVPTWISVFLLDMII